jgi:pyrophosphatase PpaX
MKKIEAVLFDVDGTLLDTREFIYQAYRHTLQSHGLPVRSLDEIAVIMSTGKSLQESYRYFSPTYDIGKLCETHRTFQAENLSLSVPFPNTHKTLKELKDAGVKTAAITTRSKRTSIKTLATSGLADYFDVILSGEDVERPKPHPEALLKVLKQLEIQPEKAVMVGDTEADILAGKSAGTKTIGVSYGFHGFKIAEVNPDFIIDDIADLLPVVFSLP